MKNKLLKTNNPYDKLNSKVGGVLTQEQFTETTFKTSNKTEALAAEK